MTTLSIHFIIFVFSFMLTDGFSSTNVSLASNNLSMFNNGIHCVAYKTFKRMFLIRTIEVVGKSCEISSQVIPVVGDKFKVEVLIPIRSLDSGEIERDRDVAKVLRSSETAELLFVTEDLSESEWKKLIQLDKFQLDGQIRIGKAFYPVVAKVQVVETPSGKEVDGVIKTQFKNLKLEPPSLVAGLAVQVKQKLELHFHLRADKTLGAETIL